MGILEVPNLVPNDATAADDNSTELVTALNMNPRVYIPEGNYYFGKLNFGGTHVLPANVEISGAGRDRTFMRYVIPGDDAPLFEFPTGPCNSVIRDLQLIGPVVPSLGSPARGRAIYINASHHNIIRDVWIYYFDTAIQVDGNTNSIDFAGYTVVEYFAITGCTFGIKLLEASNAVLLSAGRIVSSVALTGDGPNHDQLPLKGETGVGIDIVGTNGSSGPGGGSGIVISQVTVEDTPISLRIADSHDIVVIGCYFEPGYAKMKVNNEFVPMPNELTVPRKTHEIDAGSERISILGTVQSESDVFVPGDPTATENWTPYTNFQALEARGSIDTDAFRRTGSSFKSNGYGAATSGATAAHANHIRNGDMSRGTQFWTPVGSLAVGSADGPTHHVIGGRSLLLRSSANSGDHVFQDFVVDAGIRAITAVVRYRPFDDSVKAAFRIDIATVDGMNVTPLGFYSDTNPASTGWRVRGLTARFDGTLTQLQGPRTFRVRLYPYNVDGAGLENQNVLVDSVWVVDGEYAAPYRPYQEGIELLSGSDRTVLLSSVNSSSNFTAATPTLSYPANAVGMIVEMAIKSSNSSTVVTALQVNDNTGGPSAIHTVSAMLSNRTTTTELTLPLNPKATPPPQWTLSGASAGNLVTCSVVLKGWVYRL